jgi:hypothetical protein
VSIHRAAATASVTTHWLLPCAQTRSALTCSRLRNPAYLMLHAICSPAVLFDCWAWQVAG